MLVQLADGSAARGNATMPGTQAFRYIATTGVTGSAPVTGWADQSGNGLNLTVPATFSGPTFTASSINGKPAVVFDPSTQTALFNASNCFTANQARTILMIGKSSDTVGGVFFCNRLTGPVYTVSWQDIAGTNYVYTDGVSTAASIAPAPVANASHVLVSAWDGTIGANPFFSIDGTNQATVGATGVAAETGTNGFTIGNRQDAGSGSDAWHGPICEIVGWARILNATEILQIQAYVLATYGLTIGADYFQAIDQTNKTGGVELLHATQSWIVDANRVWSGKTVRRYNRALVRLTNWKSSSIKLRCISSPLTNSDGQFAVVVDGVYQTSFTVTANALSIDTTISGLTVSGSGSTVEIWEAWASKPSTQNNGADGPVEGIYVNGAYLTAPQAVAMQSPPVGIITIGDSIVGAVLGSSPEVLGVAGQLRLLAEAKGWQLASLDYGGGCLLGDGLTAANYITWITETIASLGNPPDVRIYLQPCYNDYADYGTTLTSSPTAVGTFLQAIRDGLPASVTAFVTCSFLQVFGANGGGFTGANYTTAIAGVTGGNVSTINGIGIGLAGGDFSAGGPHLTASGVTKVVAAVRGSLGL